MNVPFVVLEFKSYGPSQQVQCPLLQLLKNSVQECRDLPCHHRHVEVAWGNHFNHISDGWNLERISSSSAKPITKDELFLAEGGAAGCFFARRWEKHRMSVKIKSALNNSKIGSRAARFQAQKNACGCSSIV